MMPTAVSQVAEQSVRVAVMIALLLYLSAAGADAAGIAAGAMLGPAGGGIAGLGVMLLYWRSHRRGLQDRLPQAPLKYTAAPLHEVPSRTFRPASCWPMASRLCWARWRCR